MQVLTFAGRTYAVDPVDFLMDSRDWDETFAEGLAPGLGISGGLTPEHWAVIRFIREAHARTGRCPLVYQTCKACSLSLKGLHDLFPSGYLRGACKLAGVTYKEGFVGGDTGRGSDKEEKIYRVDVRGFLVDPEEWDEAFALRMAQDMKMEGGLTERRWEIIRYLRERFKTTGSVPTVYEACDARRASLEELERLFPDGYHRGAVKLAGLRVR